MKSDDRNNKLMFFAALLVVLLAATCFLVMLYPEVPVAVTDADKETLLLRHNQALSAVEEGEYSAAESKARQILRSFPNDLLALKIMVMVLYQQRNFAAAEKICRRIIDNIAIDLEVLNNLGVLRWQQGDAAGAAVELQRAAKLSAAHPVIQMNIRMLKAPGKDFQQLVPAERQKFPLMLTIPPDTGGKGEKK